MPTELQKLRDAVAKEEARLLEVRKHSFLHGELKIQQATVNKARAELVAYESTHA